MLDRLAMPLLRRLDAERAHRLALAGLRLGLGGAGGPDSPRLAARLAGRALANPIGLAAGFDKDGEALDALGRAGFGFVEAGTVTLRPQPGNPRPRLFRLPQDAAIINRMGFNNAGLESLLRRLPDAGRTTPLGVNIGLNKGGEPLHDYPALAAAVASRCDYVAVNVSSPNTAGLRALQAPAQLAALLGAIRAAAPQARLFVKLAPDLDDAALPDIVAACREHGAAGLIVANTTLARPDGLRGPAAEAGGLSGAPLFARATAMLRLTARLADGALDLIGVGGIRSGRDVLAKLEAGASAVQLYTALALQGPALLPRLKRELLQALDEAGHANVAAAVGADLRRHP